MVLVDTSFWVLVDRGLASVSDYVTTDDIATCPVVVHEFLRGAHDAKRYQLGREMLLRMHMLDSPMPLDRFEEAAVLYLRCRREGITVRSTADCLIAACALAYDVPVLHYDRDFVHMAEVLGLQVISA